ncbi:MAG: pyrroline-5-carboxylate reductase [Marinicaulis sp.]|nr:pyrroline-5-carboxylate reductase [Marinicaulis sp.]NNE41385.1 pyrroline-5-carboxylate reductase [Marinicaulis sp.]NNL89447.1 pyrroline-5-carboxylate reductase [Marinicaulis sp.]
MLEKPKVALIGVGSMGGALLDGWCSAHSIDFQGSAIYDPNIDQHRAVAAQKLGIAVNPGEPNVSFDVTVIAIKPQIAPKILGDYAAIAQDTLIISVVAGLSLAKLRKGLGGDHNIFRTMPNIPALYNAGVTGILAPDPCSEMARKVVDSLMSAVGETVWVESERLIDVVTAISGSGPAYFLSMTEALTSAAVELGITREKAAILARSTLIGAGIVASKSELPIADLRRSVSSPGGTTEAALNILDGDDCVLRKLVNKAVEAAAKRANELS